MHTKWTELQALAGYELNKNHHMLALEAHGSQGSRKT